MRSEQSRTLDTLRRSAQFLTDNAASLGTINTTGARAALDSSITALTTAAASQAAGATNATGESARQRALRATLRETYMRPIAMIAKQQLSTMPSFASLKMPPKAVTVASLVARAYAMAEAATANATIFTTAGLDANFAGDLTAAADAVSASVDTRAKSLGRRTSATSGLASAEKGGLAALRVVSAIVIPRLQGNAPLLAEWTSLSKVNAKLGPVAGTTVPVTPLTPVTPASQAVPVASTPPVAPVTPVTPVAPVLPGTPVAPVTQVTPAASGTSVPAPAAATAKGVTTAA